jgi:4,5-dihydroxyphthalate decarboxylase
MLRVMPTMNRILTVACVRTDRSEAVFDGSVTVDGYRLAPLALPPSEIFPRALRRAEFDVTELSASSYLVQLSRGESAYVAVPVFLSRSFRFDSIYVRSDRGIETPADLKGRRIGTPEFQMTAALWTRGILQDRFGLDFRAVEYVTGGLNVPGRQERIPISAEGVTISRAGEHETLDGLLRRGEIDAVMAPEPPRCFRDGEAPVRRLFRDPREAEKHYFAETGIFPIMHLLAVRKTLVEADPALPAALYRAFVASRDVGYRRLQTMADATSLPLMLPWLSQDLADARQALGDDYWPYGFAPNRAALDALCRYSFEQRLSASRIEPADLFDRSVLEL